MTKRLLTLLALLVFSATPQNVQASLTTYRGPCVFTDDQASSGDKCDSENTVVLGGLFPIHRANKQTGAQSCSEDLHLLGFERMEAMRFAIDLVNRQGTIPGVTLAFEMRDTCSSTDLTKQHVARFVNRAIDDGDQCGATPSAHASAGLGISGVVGASSSRVSAAAASLLGLFKIPQISYASTSAILSDKSRFPYFLRTLPPDNVQAQAISSLLDALNISYFSLIYSAGSYGYQGAADVREQVRMHNAKRNRSEPGQLTCIAVDEAIGTERSSQGEIYEAALKALEDHASRRANVLVSFVGAYASTSFFAVASSLAARAAMDPDEVSKEDLSEIRMSNDQLWITSDSWSNRPELLQPFLLPLIRGSLGVTPRSHIIRNFTNHFLSLHPDSNPAGPTYNPWLSKFWTFIFRCDPDIRNHTLRRLCRRFQAKFIAAQYEQNNKVAFVIDAVLAFAHALREFQKDECGRRYRGVCSGMLSTRSGRQRAINGEKLVHYLLKSTYTSSAGVPVSFTEHGDLATAQYDITNVQVDPLTGEGRHAKVGEWEHLPPVNRPSTHDTIQKGFLLRTGCLFQEYGTASNCSRFRLQLNTTAIQWSNGRFGILAKPDSTCSKPCLPGNSSSPLGKPYPPRLKSCCWTCKPCPLNWYTRNQFQPCAQCPSHQKSTTNRTGCIDLKAKYWDIQSPEAILAVTMSATAFIITMVTAVLGISVKHLLSSHSGLNISTMLYNLLGTAGLCSTIFLIPHKPSDMLCAIEEIAISLSLGLLLVSLFIQLLTATHPNSSKDRFIPGVGEQEKSSRPAQSGSGKWSLLRSFTGLSRKSRMSLAEFKDKGIVDAIKSHVHFTTFVLMLFQTGGMTFVLLTDPPNVHNKFDDNSEWLTGCRPSNVLLAGLGFNVLVALATIAVRLYGLKKGVETHGSLKKVAMLMPVVLLIAASGVVTSSINTSPILQSVINSFAILTIVCANLFILVIPDLLKTLLGASTAHNQSNWSQVERNDETVLTRVTRTITEKSLFNKRVRSNRRHLLIEERRRSTFSGGSFHSREEERT